MSDANVPDRVRVLLVEDNDGDAFLVEHALRGSVEPAFHLQRAQDLDEARALLLSDAIDVVLLDLGLPDSSGPPTLMALRDASATAAMVVLTGADDDALARACIELGAQDYVGKNEMTAHHLRRVIGYALSRIREIQTREAQMRELRRNLAELRAISNAGVTTGVTARLAGLGPLAEREPEAFAVLAREYGVVIETFSTEEPDGRVRRLVSRTATRIGNLGGGPRDVVDVHLAALEGLRATHNFARVEAFTVMGRQVLVETMGNLVDYYRIGVRTTTD